MNTIGLIPECIPPSRLSMVVHQVNTLGYTGGLAGHLRRKFPTTFNMYDAACADRSIQLGVPIYGRFDNVVIAHIPAQTMIGRSGVFTVYQALGAGLYLASLNASALGIEAQDIYVPYKIGCGLAGGDWSAVKPMIDFILPGSTLVIPEERVTDAKEEGTIQ